MGSGGLLWRRIYATGVENSRIVYTSVSAPAKVHSSVASPAKVYTSVAAPTKVYSSSASPAKVYTSVVSPANVASLHIKRAVQSSAGRSAEMISGNGHHYDRPSMRPEPPWDNEWIITGQGTCEQSSVRRKVNPNIPSQRKDTLRFSLLHPLNQTTRGNFSLLGPHSQTSRGFATYSPTSLQEKGLDRENVASSVGSCTLHIDGLTAVPSSPIETRNSSDSSKAEKKDMYKKLHTLSQTGATLAETLDAFIRKKVVTQADLIRWAKLLNKAGRHQNALEIYESMDRNKMTFSSSQHAVFLDLVAKTRGVAAAVDYFHYIDPNFNNMDPRAKNWPAYQKLADWIEQEFAASCLERGKHQPHISRKSFERDTVVNAYALIGPAVVRLSVAKDAYGKMITCGSGIIIDAAGIVVTCATVVLSNRRRFHPQIKIKVNVIMNDGDVLSGVVENFDEELNIAVVKIKSKRSFPVAAMGLSRNLRPGEWVLAVGFPFELQHSVTFGVISCIDRKSEELDLEGNRHGVYLQTDCAMNYGNDGGPLVDLDGQVVGVNFRRPGAGEGIGFAVPSDTVCKIVKELLKKNKI